MAVQGVTLAQCLASLIPAFDMASEWCDNLPRDKQGLPPCHGCVMHDVCASFTGQLTQSGLDSWAERVGGEFERLVECAESETGGSNE